MRKQKKENKKEIKVGEWEKIERRKKGRMTAAIRTRKKEWKIWESERKKKTKTRKNGWEWGLKKEMKKNENEKKRKKKTKKRLNKEGEKYVKK